MATPTRTLSPHYAEYTRLLRDLHSLIVRGGGDSEEADAIRDAMDGPWGKLTPEEAALARVFSAGLNADGRESPARAGRAGGDERGRSGSANGLSMILFRDRGFGLDEAFHALSARPLGVRREGDTLVVRWGDGPALYVGFASGEDVRQEAAGIGERTPHAEALGGCDARFEIAFDDLGEVLDEINTLIEVQATLQDATRGFLFNPWNGELSAPDGGT
jgi:hypothetical protein